MVSQRQIFAKIINVKLTIVTIFAGDIIQENFVDSYNNLTLKTVLMLKWTSRNCEGKGKSREKNQFT